MDEWRYGPRGARIAKTLTPTIWLLLPLGWVIVWVQDFVLQLIAFGLLLGCIVFLISRGRRLGVRVTSDSLVVENLFRTYSVAWDAVEGLVQTRSLASYTGAIVLTSCVGVRRKDHWRVLPLLATVGCTLKSAELRGLVDLVAEKASARPGSD